MSDENPFGVNQTKRLTVQTAEDLLYRQFNCLDHGFVRLIDYMGGDDAVVQSARVSYGKGTKKFSEDKGLVRYLMRHRHTTPFEMVELKFHAKMPIFVARQWIRHRTANVNEYSARYSVMDNEFYIPKESDLAVQSSSNRQGRGKTVPPSEAEKVIQLLKEDGARAYEHYTHLLNEDSEKSGEPKDKDRSMLARELARMGLSLNFYTQWYWKIDFHNLCHFLGLRLDSHAQYEIRVYAEEMAKIARAVAPNSYEAFEDYHLNSISLSGPEVECMKEILKGKSTEEVAESINNKREREEFLAKFAKIKNT